MTLFNVKKRDGKDKGDPTFLTCKKVPSIPGLKERIRNMLKTKAIKAGTGEAYCSTPEYTRVRLLNTEISHKQMTTFVELIKPHYPALKPFRIFFINRPVKYQYGVARMEIRELHVHRRAIWVFLHELAHFVAWDVYACTDSHGCTFAKCLDRLYLLWEANKDKLTNLQ